jgi:aminopeptidase N
MLRFITGDTALKQALQTYRNQVRHVEHEDPRGFQHVLEQTSHKDLAQFFDDWVYNDRGLADLSIVSVTPRNLPARNGKDVSWLVAVEVRNAGAVNVDVPITVRSGALTSTEHVHIPPQTTLSTRVVFEGVPQEVILNDGTIPETTAPMHLFRLHLPGEATK